MLFVIATNHIRELADLPKPQQIRRTQPQTRAGRATGVAAAAKRSLDDGPSLKSARPRLETTSTLSGQADLRTLDFNAMMDGEDTMGVGNEDYSHFGASGKLPGTQPLFLASQLSTAEVATMNEAGFGVENMGADELAAMLDGDGVEDELRETSGSHGKRQDSNGADSNETSELSASCSHSPDLDELEEDSMGPTQRGSAVSEKVSFAFSFHMVSLKVIQSFQPLFDD